MWNWFQTYCFCSIITLLRVLLIHAQSAPGDPSPRKHGGATVRTTLPAGAAGRRATNERSLLSAAHHHKKRLTTGRVETTIELLPLRRFATSRVGTKYVRTLGTQVEQFEL
jgi:hypothetical protein